MLPGRCAARERLLRLQVGQPLPYLCVLAHAACTSSPPEVSGSVQVEYQEKFLRKSSEALA